jgi:hypothetical protein
MDRAFNPQSNTMVPTTIKTSANAKRSQCLNKNVFQSKKPKTKKQNIELSVEK